MYPLKFLPKWSHMFHFSTPIYMVDSRVNEPSGLSPMLRRTHRVFTTHAEFSTLLKPTVLIAVEKLSMRENTRSENPKIFTSK